MLDLMRDLIGHFITKLALRIPVMKVRFFLFGIAGLISPFFREFFRLTWFFSEQAIVNLLDSAFLIIGIKLKERVRKKLPKIFSYILGL